jgi:glyoxylase-like metal-dependent hydrolase (beta-lactamase superfamily II)
MSALPTGAVPTGARPPDWATLVRARNPGPMTLTGTNTWVLAASSSIDCVVVDPGPADARHLEAVLAAVGGRQVRAVLATHGHHDHVDGVAALLERTCAAVLVAAEGSTIEGGGLRIHVLETPGHTADSRCFVVGQTMLTGDTVLGSGTSVVAWPDGDLADYLTSLRRLHGLAAAGSVTRMLPGHGPVIDDPAAVCGHYLAHRVDRIAQAQRALDDGADGPDDVVARVYPDLTGTLREAALRTVRATLVYLDAEPDAR